MRYYVRVFFDTYVKGVSGMVIDDLSYKYPEVIFKSRNEDIRRDNVSVD